MSRAGACVPLALLLLAATASPAAQDSVSGRAPAPVENLLRGLSLEQKVGQLLMVGFGGRRMEPAITSLLRNLHVGSVVLYSRNISSTSQVARLLDDIRAAMSEEVPPFLAVDQEGGNVVRLKRDVMVLPGAMALGATGDEVLAFLAGQAVATDLRLVGFNMNLAPVLDLNRDPRNPVINVRALGDEPQAVSRLGSYLLLGQQLADVATVAKHFPGHGTTSRDSHYSLPVVNLDRRQLLELDLVPFRQAIAAGLDAVMVAHVQVPHLDPSGTPASLSRVVIGDLLRRQLGFTGVVITDDLEMHAVADNYGVGRAAVKAFLAGSDIIMVIWTPARKREVYQALLQAVRDGTISRRRLDASVRRILRLKWKRGLFAARQQTGDSWRWLPNRLHQAVSRTVARRAITLVRNEGGVVPLREESRLLVAAAQDVFLKAFREYLPRARQLRLSMAPSRSQLRRQLRRLQQLGAGADRVIVAVSNQYHAWLVRELYHSFQCPLVVVSFASPYMLRYFPSVAGYLCAYSYQPTAQRAAAAALAGRLAITGHLPVTISSRYRHGHGIVLMRTVKGK